ncbi:MAG: AarF/ABC1/UbiB kinase family protein [Oligoflexia bacterium]|nr:AarF/ABC1/UbiB kinase family protein [Oligoflexia bacterium]
MSLLSQPNKVRKTFKNISRIKQIAAVFAKHGFQEIIYTLGFAKFIPNQYRKTNNQNVPSQIRLRMALEELGPTFIKLGQILSSRSDLLPDIYSEEFSKLQDRVKPISFDQIKSVIELELSADLTDIFSSFDQNPLASASIGQVHRAVLKEGSKSVVVKVQRPGIDSIIKTDISILTILAQAIEKYFPETKFLSPTSFVEEFFQTMTMELNFVLEANNILKFRENFKDNEFIKIPELYLQYSSTKILVIEELKGVKLNSEQINASGSLCRKHLASTLALSFLKSSLEDGFFHGDLHLGNLFAISSKTSSLDFDQIGLIDFGIMGYLTPRARESLIRIFYSLSEQNFETLSLEFAELGSTRTAIDFDSFERSIHLTIAPYLGLPLQRFNVGKVLLACAGVATKYHIHIPREWILIFKAIYTLEGTCRTLDPDFNAIPLLEKHLAPLVKPDYDWDQISKSAALNSRDLQQLAHQFPRQFNLFFKRFSANGYAFETKDANHEDKYKKEDLLSKRLSNSMLIASFILGSLGFFFLSTLMHSIFFQTIGFFLLTLSAYKCIRLR